MPNYSLSPHRGLPISPNDIYLSRVYRDFHGTATLTSHGRMPHQGLW